MTEPLNQQLDYFDRIATPEGRGWTYTRSNVYHIFIKCTFKGEDELCYHIEHSGLPIRIAKSSCKDPDFENGTMLVHRKTFRDLVRAAKSRKIRSIRQSLAL